MVPLPVLRGDLQLQAGAKAPDGAPSWLLHDPVRHRYFALGWREAAMLAEWSLGDADAVVQAVAHKTPLRPQREDAEGLARFLRDNELVRADAIAIAGLSARARHGQPTLAKTLLSAYFLIRLPLFRPDRLLARLSPVTALFFRPAFWWIIAGLWAVGLFATARQWEVFASTLPPASDPEGMAVYALAIILMKAVHELGHSCTAQRFGCRVPTIGIALVLCWPIPYSDVSDCVKLTERRQRLAVGGAGIASELVLAGLALAVWSLLPQGPLRSTAVVIASTASLMTVMVNLNPLMRLDGYYLFSDWLGIANLQARSFALARWALREVLFRFDDPIPDLVPRGLRRILVVYGYCVWLYRFVLFTGIAIAIYHYLFKLLGMAVLVVELWFLILRPMAAELRLWWQKRWDAASPIGAAIRLSALLACAFGAMVLFTSSDRMPAVLVSEQQVELYPPAAAKIRALYAEDGETVETGRVLFTFDRGDLETEDRRLERQVEAARTGLARALQSQASDVAVLQEELLHLLIERQGVEERLSKLEVLAPAQGQIEFAPMVNAGSWYREEDWLAKLYKPGMIVEAYATEDQAGGLEAGAEGVFIAESPDFLPLAVSLVEIDRVAIRNLDRPILASTNGGKISVRPAGKQLAPDQALYRVRMRLTSDTPPRLFVRGTAVFRHSFPTTAQRLLNRTLAIVVQEASF